MQVCTRCIIPGSFPNVDFEGGVCSFCRRHDASPRKGANVLGRDRLLADMGPPGDAGYDCVVPLSGGKDSSYILLHVVRELRRRPLAVFFDNGFVRDTARRNVERVCGKLGVDLVTGKATAHRRRLLRELLKVAVLLPKPGLPTGLCVNCENNLRTFAINEAARRAVPLILWGSIDFEDNAADVASSQKYRERFGTAASMCRRARDSVSMLWRAGLVNACRLVVPGLRCLYSIVRDNVALGAPGGWRALSPFLQVSFGGKPVKALYFFDYVPYDPYRQVEILRRELGWEAPDGHEMRMDCQLRVFSNYWHLRNTGITADGFISATLVRNGLLGREGALEKEAALKRDLEKEYLELMADLGAVAGPPPVPP